MFWSSLSREEQEQVERLAVRRTYQAKSVLFLDHDWSEHVLVILSGQVKLSRSSVDGQEMLIELRGAGSLVGELAAMEGGRRIATVTAASEVEALVVPASKFRALLQENPKLCFAVLVVVSAKLRQATERRLVASSTDALSRLAGRLVELSAGIPADGSGVVVVQSPFTQQELADWIGVSRDAVVLALRTMRASGWIETGRRVIRIVDLPALQVAAGSAAVTDP